MIWYDWGEVKGMNKVYNIHEVLRSKDETKFIRIASDAMSDHSVIVKVKGATLYTRNTGLNGEEQWSHCFLTLTWLNSKFEKIE